MASWTVVPALDDLLDQLNEIAPNRDKSSDGSIGDQSHAAGRSSHNPDRTGNPEYADGDSKNEVRARDFDADLRVPGLTMGMVVRHLVTGARSGRFWWLRYVIFEGLIYHKSTGWQARTYTGKNKHNEHAHVNTDFTQKADTVSGVDYGLEEIPVALTAADKNWLVQQIDARADLIEKNLIERLPAAVGDLKVDVNPGQGNTPNWQPWSRVDAYGSPERKAIKALVQEVLDEVRKGTK